MPKETHHKEENKKDFKAKLPKSDFPLKVIPRQIAKGYRHIRENKETSKAKAPRTHFPPNANTCTHRGSGSQLKPSFEKAGPKPSVISSVKVKQV